MMDDEQLTTDPDALASHISQLIQACEDYASEQKVARDRALEYYDGQMRDLVSDEGRSSVVSQDIRAAVKKVLPSIMRTLLANDRLVEYEPAGPGTEQQADQATNYVNRVVVPECGAEHAIHDAILDALLVKTGILKWVAYERREAKVYSYTDQPTEALAMLEELDDVDILSVETRPETDPEVLGIDPEAQRHDLTVRRVESRTDLRLEAVPRGSFLIYPGAVSIDESPLVGERMVVTRSDLVSWGYDRETVANLSEYSRRDSDADDSISRMGDDWTDTKADPSHALQEVEIYEVYVRLDQDDDGIAEIYKICFAEGRDAGEQRHHILAMEQVDEAPYAAVVIERTAHEFEGRSLAEDLIEIQRIKTVLTRETLDNIYWQNRPQPSVNPSKLTPDGLDAVFNPQFGKPITLAPGAQDVREAVQWNQVPFVARYSFDMLSFMDEAARDRTGITDQSGGLDPESFRNMSATSAQIINETGIAQAEMMIRSISRGGLRKAFRGLLRLVIAHADKPRTVRLRGQWVEYDPRQWDAGMDCVVNVGLGAGSRERDLNVLQMVLGLQEKLFASIGPDNPYVKPDQLYNVLAKIVETAGFPSAEPYFTEPDPQEIQAAMQAAQGPSIEEKKMQQEMQLEQVKAQSRTQIEQAQMQADFQVKQLEAELQAKLQAAKAGNDAQIAEMKAEIDLLKHRERLEYDYRKAALDAAQAPSGRFQEGSLYDGS